MGRRGTRPLPSASAAPHPRTADRSYGDSLVGRDGLRSVFSLFRISVSDGLTYVIASPYLIGLGLTKSQMSLVLTAGPISGLIVQPLVGGMADRFRLLLFISLGS